MHHFHLLALHIQELNKAIMDRTIDVYMQRGKPTQKGTRLSPKSGSPDEERMRKSFRQKLYAEQHVEIIPYTKALEKLATHLEHIHEATKVTGSYGFPAGLNRSFAKLRNSLTRPLLAGEISRYQLNEIFANVENIFTPEIRGVDTERVRELIEVMIQESGGKNLPGSNLATTTDVE